jgi:hypothetical protein
MGSETNINGDFNEYTVEEYTPDSVSGGSEQMNKYLFYCAIIIVVLFVILKYYYEK